MERIRSLYHKIREIVMDAVFYVPEEFGTDWVEKLSKYSEIDLYPEIDSVMSFQFEEKKGVLVERKAEIKDTLSIHETWTYRRKDILDSPYIYEIVFERTAFEDYKNALYNRKDVVKSLVKEVNKRYSEVMDRSLYSDNYPHVRAVVSHAYVYPRNGKLNVDIRELGFE